MQRKRKRNKIDVAESVWRGGVCIQSIIHKMIPYSILLIGSSGN